MYHDPYEIEDATKTWKFYVCDPNRSRWPAENLNNGRIYLAIKKLLKYDQIENVVVPNQFQGVPIKAIRGDAFRTLEPYDDGHGGDYIEDENECMKTVDIQEGISVLEKQAFEYCYALESVTMPDSLVKIGFGAFDSCKALRKVVFSNGLKEIPPACFQSCSGLEEIVMPASLQTISGWAFNACGLKKIYLNEGLRIIADHAFMQCKSLQQVTLPRSLQSIDESAFDKCSEEITAYCYNGSYAYFYAKEHGFNIELM